MSKLFCSPELANALHALARALRAEESAHAERALFRRSCPERARAIVNLLEEDAGTSRPRSYQPRPKMKRG